MPRNTTICKSCASSNLRELRSEICVHLPAFVSLNKDPFFIFPKLIVCAECGFSEFIFPEAQLFAVRECTKHDVRVPL
jgi:hypothetical protein